MRVDAANDAEGYFLQAGAGAARRAAAEYSRELAAGLKAGCVLFIDRMGAGDVVVGRCATRGADIDCHTVGAQGAGAGKIALRVAEGGARCAVRTA